MAGHRSPLDSCRAGRAHALRAREGREPRRGRSGSAHDPGQPVPGKRGRVGKAITVHQGLLQRPRSDQARTCLRAAVPRARFTRRGGFVNRALEAFQRGAAARLDEQLRAGQPPEAPRRAAPVDRCPTIHVSGCPSSTDVESGSEEPGGSWRSSENEIGLEGDAAQGSYPGQPSAASRAPSSSTAAPCPRISTSGT